MKKFPHIEQFRNVVATVKHRHDYAGKVENTAVFEHTSPYPTMHFIGTPKIHGSNCGVVNNGVGLVCNSNGSIIDKENDHHGFVKFIDGLDGDVKDIVFKTNHHWFGEWCGQGIQKGCAIHKLSKRFIILDHCEIIDSEYTRDDNLSLSKSLSSEELQLANANNIFFIDQFERFQILIDFEDLTTASEKLERMVAEVENQCPVGKYFGVDGIGEGIVWRSLAYPADSKLWFKTKGVKHKNTKSKRLVEIDPVKAASVAAFIEFSVTEQRLEQSKEELHLTEYENVDKRIGEFIKWINVDIARECADDLKASELTMRDVSKAICVKSLAWYRTHV